MVVAGAIFVALLGTMYAAAADAEDEAVSLHVLSVPSPPVPDLPVAPPTDEPVPAGQDVPEAVVAMLDAEREEMVDAETGMRIGPLTFRPEPEPVSTAAPAARERRAGPRRSAPPPSVGPRLHADPGRHVILTARAMRARGETTNGSCYRYISEVFARAGHSGWRNRRTVYGEGRNGPYADLGVIRPGDWLYIVNHPERTPVGTHSVLFVGWQDRARGYAHVIEHPGWGAATSGRERTYDVSRTYRVIRPVLRR